MTDLNSLWSLEILPETNIRTGMSIFVVVKPIDTSMAGATPPLVYLSSDMPQQTGMHTPIALKLEHDAPKEWRKEFTLMLAGDYTVSMGKESRVVHIANQDFMSFNREFGIFSGATVLLVGGLLVWLLKSKKNRSS